MLTIRYIESTPHYFYIGSNTYRNSDDYGRLMALFKRNGGKLNDRENIWTLSCSVWDFFTKEISLLFPQEEIKFNDETTLFKIKEAAITPGELVRAGRIIFKNDFLKFPSLAGKHPNETFQAQDITKALNQNRFLFNWWMSLGKSYCLTYLIKSLMERGETNKALILTTKIGSRNLKDEILKFWDINPEEILVLSSVKDTPFEERGIFSNDKYKIVILTYSVLRFISNYYYDVLYATKKDPHPGKNKKYKKMPIPFKEWFEGKKGCIFLDESHWLGNPKAEQTRILLGHIDNFYYRYLFTGTFAPKMEKMYTQLRVLDPAITHYLNYEQWCAVYNEVGNFFSEWAINPLKWKYDRIALLNERVAKNYASKRTLRECLDLPPTIDVPPIIIDMHPLHRQAYELFVDNYFKLLSDDSEEQGKSLTQKIMKSIMLFQTCVDNPEVLKDTRRFNELEPAAKGVLEQYDYLRHNSKIEVINDILEDRLDEGGDTKGLIWYTHPLTGKALNTFIKRKHLWVGEDTKKSPNDIINEFKHGNYQVLIISLLSCNTSITITEAQFNIFVERSYSAAELVQAAARIPRPGQDQITRNYTVLFDRSLDMLQEVILTKNSKIIDTMASKGFIDQREWSNIFNMSRKDII